MLIGAHISATGGVQNAPLNAKKAALECYQFFSRPPQGGQAPELTVGMVRTFKERNKKYNFEDFYIHAPYYINLASLNNRIYYGSINVLRQELERGTKLGAKYMMTHLGSAKDLGEEKAIKKVVEGIKEVLKGYQGTCQFLIEMSAGAGMIIGDRFEEIAKIIRTVEKNIKCQKSNVNCQPGVCYDTAHAFASGYDIRNKKAVKKTFDEFDKIIGLERLKLIHANDLKTDLGSHIDRHEHIGYGKIGLTGFQALIHEPRVKKINLIIETPKNGKDTENIKILKKLRDGK